jgi:hypothetical protein
MGQECEISTIAFPAIYYVATIRFANIFLATGGNSGFKRSSHRSGTSFEELARNDSFSPLPRAVHSAVGVETVMSVRLTFHGV